jgi:hypothetical protein
MKYQIFRKIALFSTVLIILFYRRSAKEEDKKDKILLSLIFLVTAHCAGTYGWRGGRGETSYFFWLLNPSSSLLFLLSNPIFKIQLQGVTKLTKDDTNLLIYSFGILLFQIIFDNTEGENKKE